MDLKQLTKRAVEVRNKYKKLELKKYGKEWDGSQIMQGFVGDVGDLAKLVIAKEGIRDIAGVDEKFSHEIADCLWSILVLADKYGVDAEKSFLDAMEKIEKELEKEI